MDDLGSGDGEEGLACVHVVCLSSLPSFKFMNGWKIPWDVRFTLV